MHEPPPTLDDVIQLLTHAWSDALGVAATPESDFLALGGTSLSALVVAQAVTDAYREPDGLDSLALEAVFEQPSLRAVAERVHAFLSAQLADDPSISSREDSR